MAFLSTAWLQGAENEIPASEMIAATADLWERVAITRYDIALRTELEQNRLSLEALCTVRNQGESPLNQVDFDLLKAEQEFGAKAEVNGVWAIYSGGRRACAYQRVALEVAGDSKAEETRQRPKLVRVKLPSSLPPRAECRLVFDYTIAVLDPARDTGYRLIAQLPSGDKEVCLMDDFTWVPRPFQGSSPTLSLGGRDFFTREAKATWQIRISHPATLESLVLDGRLEHIMKTKQTTVSLYTSISSSRPQLSIGPCERVVVPGPGISVVFLLPKGKYSQPEITNSAGFLQRSYGFYTNLFGPLAGKPIHVAVSSADMGGHGAFLGMFLDSLPAREPNSYDHTAAHELAHSWAVSSYGRGTKFLRESFANFAAWQLARTAFHRDFFQYETVRLFCYGLLAQPLFLATGDVADYAYTKGVLVMDLLRQEMGDETFFTTLRRFRSKYQECHATFADFVAACNDVSRRDWLPFLTHWCYGHGLPVYHLVEFNSVRTGSCWKTTITFTNAGQGVVTCPVEIQTLAGPQRERFAVSESERRSFIWSTPAQATNVVIDPDHISLQGDADELRLKLLALPDALVRENWPWYWKAVAHAEVGDYPHAEALLSRALAEFAKLERKAPPNVINPYYYTRGVVRLRTGQPGQATEDFHDFLEGILQPENKNPPSAQAVTHELVYARLLTGKALQDQMDQLRQLLCLMTGADLPVNSALTEWRQWWLAHRVTFQPGPDVRLLRPGGIRVPPTKGGPAHRLRQKS